MQDLTYPFVECFRSLYSQVITWFWFFRVKTIELQQNQSQVQCFIASIAMNVKLNLVHLCDVLNQTTSSESRKTVLLVCERDAAVISTSMEKIIHTDKCLLAECLCGVHMWPACSWSRS